MAEITAGQITTQEIKAAVNRLQLSHAERLQRCLARGHLVVADVGLSGCYQCGYFASEGHFGG